MLKISRESEINIINMLIDQDIISGKDLPNIKKISKEGNKSQIDAVFELKLASEDRILEVLVKEQNLETVDLSQIPIGDNIKSVLPTNYINMNFVAPFKVEGKTLHIAIPDSSKLSLMRNLKTITKKNIELHAAKVSQISDFIEKLLAESGDVTTETIKKKNKEKIKTFDSDLAEAGEVLDTKPEEDIEAIENGAEAAIIGPAAKQKIGSIDQERILVIEDNLDYIFGQIIAEFWNRPSRKLKLIGVTGTNGKTTITFLLEYLLIYLQN